MLFVFVISGIVNVLALTGAFYMLQIYDRTLASQSVPTLLALSALAIGLYLFQGVFDILRSQVLVRVGAQLDVKLAPLAHKVTIDMPRFGFSTTEALERGRDVDTLRGFLGGQGPIALFDLPWVPIYLAFVYLLHPWLGAAVFGGALVLAALTLLTEVLTRGLAGKAHQSGITRQTLADAHARNSEVLRAMGFTGRAIARYETANAEHLALQTRTNDIAGTLTGLSKVLRMILQSAILGLGAYLTIRGEMSAGAIIAASVASGRALAPVDMAIAQWKGIAGARRSYARLSDTLSTLDDGPAPIALPAPKSSLKVEKMTVATPTNGTVVMSDIAFELKAGQALGLIGPTGGGKSSLAKALTGVWPLVRGSVRLDDAELDQWAPDALGRHLGYLPQDVALLDGSIADNICRFDPSPDGAAIIEAARAAGVHELIVRLPAGYQTELGPQGTNLSAGQRQRIGLARALYGRPFLVVLDEPNSNLDADGDAALTEAIKGIRARGAIAIVIAHRPSALNACDMVGVVQAGRLVAFGPKDEIIQGQMRGTPTPVPTPVPSVVPVPSPANAAARTGT
jgi:ATP-binding cassette subfamily C protein